MPSSWSWYGWYGQQLVAVPVVCPAACRSTGGMPSSWWRYHCFAQQLAAVPLLCPAAGCSTIASPSSSLRYDCFVQRLVAASLHCPAARCGTTRMSGSLMWYNSLRAGAQSVLRYNSPNRHQVVYCCRGGWSSRYATSNRATCGGSNPTACCCVHRMPPTRMWSPWSLPRERSSGSACFSERTGNHNQSLSLLIRQGASPCSNGSPMALSRLRSWAVC
jgi:hypothetical protein